VFGDEHGCAGVKQILRRQGALEVDPECATYPAVQQWIYRMHLENNTLHQTPQKWLEAYPQKLKRCALIFLRHNGSAGKGRVSCKFTFAYLVAGLFNRKVCFYHIVRSMGDLPRVEQSNWILPKAALDDANECILDEGGTRYTGVDFAMKFTKSVIMYHGNSKFTLLLTAKTRLRVSEVKKRQKHRDDLICGGGGGDMNAKEHLYVLRKFYTKESDGRNVVVGNFVQVAPGSSAFLFWFVGDGPESQPVYMVYSNHTVTGKTELHIPQNCTMFVFYVAKDEVFYSKLCTDSCDIPPRFRLTPDLCGIVVVVAPSLKLAESVIESDTHLKLIERNLN